MARRRRGPRKDDAFLQSCFDIPSTERDDRQDWLPVAHPGGIAVSFVEVDARRAVYVLDRSATMNKDLSTENGVVTGFASEMRCGAFGMNGDTLILGRAHDAYEGVKRLRAVVEAGVTVRMPVVVTGVPESRFATGRPSTAAQSASRRAPRATRPYTTPPAPPSVPAGASVAEALALRTGLVAFLGDSVLTDLSPGAIHACADAARAVAATGFPLPAALLVSTCVTLAAHAAAPAFLTGWADPSDRPGSPASYLARALREGGMHDDLPAAMALVAVALEMHVEGRDGNPATALASSLRTRQQLVCVLAGRRGGMPQRLVTLAVERHGEQALREFIAAGGRPLETWTDTMLAPARTMAGDIAADGGLWMTGETAKFSHGGYPLDGILRFAACVLAGKDFVGVVARGFAEDFDHVRTTGRAQSFGNRIYAEDGVSPYDIPGIATVLCKVLADDCTAGTTEPSERRMQRENPVIQKTVMLCHALKPRVYKSALGAGHVLLARYSRRLSDMFMSELAEVVDDLELPVGERKLTLPRHATLGALLREFERIKDGDGDKDRVGQLTLGVTVEAMNAWCADEAIDRFTPPEGNAYHKLAMPPQVRDNVARNRQGGERPPVPGVAPVTPVPGPGPSFTRS